MRLSRPRLLLRVALLTVGGVFLLWRGWEAWSGAREGGPAAPLGARAGVVFALMGTLALLTAAGAALALRRPRGRIRLGLGQPPLREEDAGRDHRR